MKKLVLGLLFFGVSCGTPVDPLNAASDCRFYEIKGGWTFAKCGHGKSLLSPWYNQKGEQKERMSLKEMSTKRKSVSSVGIIDGLRQSCLTTLLI